LEVIDEENRLVPIERVSPPILEILESLKQNPLEGNDVWIKMGIEVGYTNLTSSTSVRIKYAYQCPFPTEEASKDFYAWMRMSDCGARFKYSNSIPTKYRIPRFMKYQSSCMRVGLSKFNKIIARVDSEDFSKSIEISLVRNTIKPEEIPSLKAKFYKRLAKSMNRQMGDVLADELLNKSKQLENEGFIYLDK
jgi:hypothetical protein